IRNAITACASMAKARQGKSVGPGIHNKKSKKAPGTPARSTGVAGLALPPLLIVAAHGVLQSADCVLHLAGGLVALAFRFGLGVAGYLSDLLLHGSLRLVSRAFHAIFVHGALPFVCVAGGQRQRTCIVPRLVSRFRSSPEFAACSGANFGIEGH